MLPQALSLMYRERPARKFSIVNSDVKLGGADKSSPTISTNESCSLKPSVDAGFPPFLFTFEVLIAPFLGKDMVLKLHCWR